MKKKLGDIAEIRSGVYSKTTDRGGVHYIQAKNFDENNILSPHLTPNLLLNPQVKKNLLRKGDVLFASKGFDNFAAVYNSDYKTAVASSIFLILYNIDNEIVLPAYLAWFINQPGMQEFLKRSAKGTSLPSISKRILSDIYIEIPTIKKQELILRVSNLIIREKKIRRKIQERREKLLNHQLLNVISNE